MPTYEYACRACGQHLEVVQSFKDDPLTECPQCGGSLRKVFGNIGIAFKGSGFYKTDSRSASSSAKSSAPTKEGGSSADSAASATAKPSSTDSSSSSSSASSGNSSSSSAATKAS